MPTIIMRCIKNTITEYPVVLDDEVLQKEKTASRDRFFERLHAEAAAAAVGLERPIVDDSLDPDGGDGLFDVANGPDIQAANLALSPVQSDELARALYFGTPAEERARGAGVRVKVTPAGGSVLKPEANDSKGLWLTYDLHGGTVSKLLRSIDEIPALLADIRRATRSVVIHIDFGG